jgi:hypothetical protein
MGDSVSKFFLDNSFLEEPKEDKEVLSEDVVNILELFRLLSINDKIVIKKLIRNETVF